MKTMLRFVAAAALAGGLMVAGEPGGTVHVDLRDASLADALKEIEAKTGRRFECPPALLEGRKVTFVKTGTVDDVFNQFGTTLEIAQSITLVPGRDGAMRLIPFTKKEAKTSRPPTRGRRLSVEVVEGTVILAADPGRVTVRAGERSFVSSGALPAPPTPFDTATVAPWRFPEAPAAAGIDARVALPEIHFRLLGYTDKGDPIVEYEVNGVKQTLDFGTLDIPESERKKIVIENGELLLPFTLRLKVDKGSK